MRNREQDSAKYFILGGSWISSSGYSLLSERRRPIFDGADMLHVPKEFFTNEPIGRYGRFDTYTKAGFAAAGLALKDAGFSHEDMRFRNCGIIASSLSGSYESDLKYYESASCDAALASPNLFSYTLPGIMLGECAVHFKLGGPSLCMTGNEAFGILPLISASAMIYSGAADRMLAGAVECGQSGIFQGAVFFVISRDCDDNGYLQLDYNPVKRSLCNCGTEIKNITEIFY